MCAQYVTHSAKIKCNYGSEITNLQVLPDRSVTLSQGHYANVSDHEGLVNIPSFGVCRSYKYPPTKSATDAHHGSLTPMPCHPGTLTLWQNGNESYLIRRYPALLTSSYCRCIYGGLITIVTDGQNQDTYEIPKEIFLQKEAADFNEDEKEDEERGLDAIDFIPVVGSIRDITDGIKSGDKGLIAFGAVFLVADIVGIVGSIFSGGAASVGVTAAKSTAKAGLKAVAKTAAKETAKHAAIQGEKVIAETVAKETVEQTVKQGEHELLDILMSNALKETIEQIEKETFEGISEEAIEAVLKKPNFFKGITEVAEKGASEVVKSPKAVSLLDDAFKFVEKSSKGILDSGLKQVDEIAKAGKEFLNAAGKVTKTGWDSVVKEVKGWFPYKRLEEINTLLKRETLKRDNMLRTMGRL